MDYIKEMHLTMPGKKFRVIISLPTQAYILCTLQTTIFLPAFPAADFYILQIGAQRGQNEIPV
jgi:hypothetical protein